jgi:VIT1/CCC1 family predicted Fe2+/Mn2+ transporter
MNANLLLWIGQVILAVIFAGLGFSHSIGFDRSAEQPRMRWLKAVGRRSMAVIGVLEILGALGLILPAATGILPWLTPTAAALVVVLMVFVAAFHLRRTDEGPNVVLNVVLGVMAALVAYGRFIAAPL